MDVEHSDAVQIKEEVKDEPMSPSNADGIKNETKPVVPEPIQPNALDKKKKCCKYTFFACVKYNISLIELFFSYPFFFH